ncbi:oxidoreductase [Pedobacter sp. L105]|uniref:oxidoreductase n=1 Tax=Pedobacter sp. L105 TaxID=1641871 RepID=UPI00131CA6C6|nr:oxidoreductase [Pedobacter sp. L105]
METQRKTWFITGTSQGIGLVLVQKLLSQGYNVVATARNLEVLKTAVNVNSDSFLPLQLDLTDEENIAGAVKAAVEKFGTIDVLVNNAGYGLMGGIEESSDQEVKANFDVNVFGLLNVTRKILPVMRKHKSGHIFNLSSVFGLIAGAGWGIYCATKFAVEGLSEALAQEIKPFGINLTIIEPGYFRTNFLSGSSIVVPEHPILEYTAIEENKRKHSEDIPGNQPGDPEKAADVMISIAQLAEAPLRLLLGSDAYQFANYKIQMLQEGMESNKAITLSTDFAD